MNETKAHAAMFYVGQDNGMMAGQGTMIDDVYVRMCVQAPVINLLRSPVTYQLVLWV